MSYEVVYREKYGSDGKDITYVKYPDNDKLYHLKPKVESVHQSLLERLKIFFQEVFLPQGYPESVSEDYWNYQVWDSLQAFCSTLSGTLTTHAIMKGVGVGDTNTTPLSAAITWVLKDGTGMVGRILFAWKKGTSLDADCKKWRLFADFLNDSAMCVEMFLLPVIPKFSTELLCVSTTMKAIVGVAGGATKAATTQHQAIRNNMGDVSAKDGSQETCLNLIGSIFGIFLLSFVAESERLAKLIFVICILLHMYSNYRAVKALNFKTLNKERLLIILKTYFKYYIIENSDRVNNKESVFLGTGIRDEDFCGFQIKMGCSLKHLIDHNLLSNDEFRFYSYGSECCNNSYLVIVNNPLKTIFVPLKPDHNDKDALLAYYHAVLLGIATSISNNFKLKIPLEIDKLSAPLNELMEKLKRNSISDFKNRSKEFIINTGLTSGKESVKINNISFEEITKLDANMKKEFEVFLKSLKESGWIIDRHHLPVGEWRANWASDIHSKTI